MTLYSFIGVAVTSATAIIFGQAIWDPVQVLARLGNPIAVVMAMLALLLATLERERRGKSGLALQRFLESLASADQFSDGRTDYLRRGRAWYFSRGGCWPITATTFSAGWWAIPDFSARSRA